MHPIKAAIEALHAHTTKMHIASQTATDNDGLVGLLVGMLPDLIEAANELVIASFQFLTNR